MAQLIYQINSGYPNFTAHIEPNEAADQIHPSLGIYSFDDIPDGMYSLTVTDNIGCEAFFDNINIGTLGQPLRLLWDDVINVPVEDVTSLPNWNTFFDLPIYGGEFSSIVVNGIAPCEVLLYGGSNITLKESLFGNSGYGTNLLEVEDFANCVTIINDNVFGDDIPYSEGCYNLILGSFPAVTSVKDYSFGYCEKLSYLNLPICTELISRCFSNCIGLTEIILPFNSFTVLGENIFNDCPLLTGIIFDNVMSAGKGCFSGTTVNPQILLPIVKYLGESCFALSSFVDVYMPFVEEVGDYCFSDCNNLQSLNLPACIKLGINVDMNEVFNNIFGKVITLTIPAALMTCNLGQPDGDIEYLVTNNTVTIIQV